MNDEKKKAVPVVVHRDGKESQIALEGVRLPTSDHSTRRVKAQGLISSILPHGARQAVSLQRLAEITGLSSREVRRAIQRERLQGVPICSDNLTGYFLAENDAERAAFCKSMRHRARQILRAARAVEQGGASD